MNHAPDCPASLGPMACCCGACSPSVTHASGCAVHNAPALPVGDCDCGVAVRVTGADDGDAMVSEVVERELPGFWAFLKARHPEFQGVGKPDGPPIGYVHAFEVHEAMAETIPAYVRALRQAM